MLTDAESRVLLQRARQAVLKGDVYPALRHLRALLPGEERALAATPPPPAAAR